MVLYRGQAAANLPTASFVTVFFTDRIDEARGRQIGRALASVKDHPELMTAMETSIGFVALPDKSKTTTRSAATGKPPAAKKK